MSDREWVYGDILRRAVTMKPLVYAYVMYLGPGVGKDHRRPAKLRFTGIRLTAVTAWPHATGANERGWVGRRLLRELFEITPEDEQ